MGGFRSSGTNTWAAEGDTNAHLDKDHWTGERGWRELPEGTG